jgi:hypothetical protein
MQIVCQAAKKLARASKATSATIRLPSKWRAGIQNHLELPAQRHQGRNANQEIVSPDHGSRISEASDGD